MSWRQSQHQGLLSITLGNQESTKMHKATADAQVIILISRDLPKSQQKWTVQWLLNLAGSPHEPSYC